MIAAAGGGGDILEGRGDELPGTAGSYVLLMRSSRSGALAIGRLGTLSLQPGWYLYAGSAFGPGGLRSRVGRHLRTGKRPRWHVDYLREMVTVEAVWYAEGRMECVWAARLAEMPGATMPLHRFGASDCRCAGHLWHFPERPDLALFGRRAVERVETLAGGRGEEG